MVTTVGFIIFFSLLVLFPIASPILIFIFDKDLRRPSLGISLVFSLWFFINGVIHLYHARDSQFWGLGMIMFVLIYFSICMTVFILLFLVEGFAWAILKYQKIFWKLFVSFFLATLLIILIISSTMKKWLTTIPLFATLTTFAANDGEIQRLARMRETLEKQTIEEFMVAIHENKWAAPRIPSKWHVENPTPGRGACHLVRT